MKRILTYLTAVVLAAPVSADSATERFQTIADRLVKAINAKDYTTIHNTFDAPMKTALPPDKTKAFFSHLIKQNGPVKSLGRPRLTPPAECVFAAHFEQATVDLKIVLNQQDKIAGLWFLPARKVAPILTTHKTEMRLPFEGKWYVYWGGDTAEDNHHHHVPCQKHALDLVILGKNGKTFKGEGRKNEDYYAFGQPIIAPADGVVTDVIRGVRDNEPGSMNPYSVLGNAVIIAHRKHEVSVFAHFKLGSIKVKVGDRVKQGQLIGLCGNSGNSSEAHIHYHLQNTEPLQDATGIKCLFSNVTVTKNGKTTTQKQYAPVKGDTVSPQ